MSGSITHLVRTLVAVGATPEMILAAVESAEASKDNALETSREKARNRIKKWREKQDCNVTERSVTTTEQLVGAKKSSSLKVIDSKKENKKENKKDATSAPSDLDAFRSELSSLDAVRLEAIVKHRRLKRAAITGHAASLFRKDAAAAR